MDCKQQFHLWYFVAAFMGLMLVQLWLSQGSVTQRIRYGTFLGYLEDECITDATVRAERIDLRYHDSVDGLTPADVPPLYPQQARAA